MDRKSDGPELYINGRVIIDGSCIQFATTIQSFLDKGYQLNTYRERIE